MTADPPEATTAPYIPLPAGLANPRATAGGVFDGIAALYDRARPGYPAEAIAGLVDLCGVGRSTEVLEVGCGTGQLTRDLAATGASILAVEAGPALADLARDNLVAHRNVAVVTARFEDLDVPAGTYHLVVSATAFHWIDPDISYAKAGCLLAPNGWLVLMTNTHAAGGSHTSEPFASRLRELHRRLAPEVGDWSFPATADIQARASGGGDIAAVWSRVERRLSEPTDVSALFESPTVETFPWLASYDRDGYLAMLASQSSYALMDPARRDELLNGIGSLIDNLLEGVVTKEYVTVVAAARHSGKLVTG